MTFFSKKFEIFAQNFFWGLEHKEKTGKRLKKTHFEKNPKFDILMVKCLTQKI